MALPDDFEPRTIPAVAIIHQEGVLALIALVGLFLRSDGSLEGLAPRGGIGLSLLVGAIVGAGSSVVVWLFREMPSLKDLLQWQRNLVSDWTVTDAVVVALISGIAEEALLRALLQPILGLIPAAIIFAVLHLVPDRRLWMWPVIAFVFGLILGGVFERAGYPAAALAHIIINGISLLRLRAVVDGSENSREI